MKKRILFILLVIALSVISLFGMTACSTFGIISCGISDGGCTGDPPDEEFSSDESDESKYAEIKKAYYDIKKEHFTSEYYTYTADDISLSCYGQYGDSFVMFIDTPFYMYAAVITTETVDGVSFVYGSSHSLDVYNNGAFYSVTQAFENGLLTHDDLLEILYRMENSLYVKA